MSVILDNDETFKALDSANPSDLLRAIIVSRDIFQERGFDVGSDKWSLDTRICRPQMLKEVMQQWCNITLMEEDLFPYHEDFVAGVWMAYRKAGTERKAALRQAMFRHQDLFTS